MLISEIYNKYPINKGLRNHMLRVAAVAKMIIDNTSHAVDEELIVTSCLLHDLGNLVKVNFSLPNLEVYFEPEGVAYWQEKQFEIWETISQDEHEVTNHYLNELGVGPEIIEVVNSIELTNIKEILEKKSIEEKIIQYADLRVGLNGIVSTTERLADIKARYVPSRFTNEFILQAHQWLADIETFIFSRAVILPTDITETTTAKLQKVLLQFDIATK